MKFAFPFLLAITLLGCLPLTAQVRQYYFTHYSTSSGLVSNETNCVIQDADGYIWSGSAGGLQRFDGTRFRTFRNIPGDPGSIPANNVTQLILDDKNNLWVVTIEGRVGIFDTRTFRFREATIKPKRKESYLASGKRLIRDELSPP